MILVGIDDRPAARDALVLGRWLASARSEELLLAWVHPYEQLPSLLGEGPEQVAVRRAIEGMAEDVRATLPIELRPEMRLVSGGSAAEGLQELAEREQASLIVLGASERSGIGRIVPGSTAVRLLSGSTVPVAVAPCEYTERPGPEPMIGAGFDGGAEAERALEWAAALAGEVGGGCGWWPSIRQSAEVASFQPRRSIGRFAVDFKTRRDRQRPPCPAVRASRQWSRTAIRLPSSRGPALSSTSRSRLARLRTGSFRAPGQRVRSYCGRVSGTGGCGATPRGSGG